MKCGIYKLEFSNINKNYVGKSVDIEGRYSQHRSKILSRTHVSSVMEAYKENGELPTLVVLQECEKAELDSLEVKYIGLFGDLNTTHKNKGVEIKKYDGVFDLADINKIGNEGQFLESLKFVMKDDLVYGVYKVTKFERDYNIPQSALGKVLTGVRNKAGNFTKTYTPELNDICNLEYILDRCHILEKDGVLYPVVCPQWFSEWFNIDRGSMTKLLKGSVNTAKGFRLFRLPVILD